MGSVNSAISQNTSTIVNNLTNKMTSNMVKSCENNVENIQDVQIILKNIDGCSLNYSGTDQKMDAKVDANCVQTSISKTELQSNLNNALDQFTKSTSSIGLLSASSTISKNIADVRSTINNERVLNDIMTALNKGVNKQGNTITVDGYKCRPVITRDMLGNETIHGDTLDLGNTSQALISNTIFKGLQSSDELNKAVTALDTAVKQTAESTTLGLFDGIAQAGGPLIAIAVVIAVAVVLMALIKVGIFGGSKDKNGQVQIDDDIPVAAVVGGVALNENYMKGRLIDKNAKYYIFGAMVCAGFAACISAALGLIESIEPDDKKADKTEEQLANQQTIIALFATSLATYGICMILFFLFSFTRNNTPPQNFLSSIRNFCSKRSGPIYYSLIFFITATFFLAMGSIIVKLSIVNQQNQILTAAKTPAPV